MRKLLALVLGLIMMLTVAAAYAEDNLSITIPKTNEGQIYKIYKLFDATVTESHETGGEGISYQLMNGKTLPDDNTWFQVDLAGNVTAKDGIEEKDIITDAFKDWATGYGIELTDKQIEGNGAEQSFTGLSDGYYFITTTTGTLVTVTSVGPDVEVEDKNPGTTIDKKIHSAETGSVESDGEKALSQIGSSVTFESRVPIKDGALNYVFKDNMSDGLTCNGDVEVFLVDAGGVVEESTAAIDQTVCGAATYPDSGDYDIVLPFDNAWLKANKGKDIVIRYSATVNSNAVIAEDGNPNTARIEWGNTEDPLFNQDDAVVYTAQISVIKYEGSATSEDAKFLGGAGFKLKNADGKYYKLDNGVVTWVDAEESGDEHVSAEADGKMPPFIGLPDGVYTLVETTVPEGFNKASDTTVTIKDQDYAAKNLDQTANVENRQGTELPSTGGIGTTIFYVIGGVLILGAAIILVARRKAESK